MGVNAIVDNASSQQMAVAMSNSLSVELKELQQKEPKDSRGKKVHSGSDVSKLVQDGANPSKAGMNILLSLAGKLATVGVNLTTERFSGRAQDDLENEFNRMLGGKENAEDLVDLKNMVGRVNERKDGQSQQQKESEGNEQGMIVDREVQNSVREYSALYAQYTITHSSETKKKLDQLEAELGKKGLTGRDFNSIKTAATNSIRKELAEQVKDAFFKKVLSPDKSIEMVVSEKGLNDILDFALFKGVHDNESLQSMANDIMKDTTEELQGFAKEKIEERLTRKHLTADPTVEKKADSELKELVKLAIKAGVDLNEFARDWQVKKYDLGLFIPDNPIGQGGMNSNGQDQAKKNLYEFTPEDEKDLQVSRLRALYMHRALTGDWKTMLETYFKMRKLKNGLIKLGVSSNEFDRIEKEGRAAARLRLLEMLKTVLEERATLYELAGPAFKLIEQKIRGILSNLERLDWKLDEVEFNSIRDAANLKVFEAARGEFLALKDMLDGASNPAIEKRYKLVLKLLKRLKEESKLASELPDESFVIKEAV